MIIAVFVSTLSSINTIILPSANAAPSSTGCENAQGAVVTNPGNGFNPHCRFIPLGPPTPDCKADDAIEVHNPNEPVVVCSNHGND